VEATGPPIIDTNLVKEGAVHELTLRRFICPICGYAGLDEAPYEKLSGPPFPIGLRPPYRLVLGDPSYDVCICCGFEYGNDDDPGTAPGVSFEEYRANWISHGCQWFYESERPKEWRLEDQFRAGSIVWPAPYDEKGYPIAPTK
jgi:rubredoxin